MAKPMARRQLRVFPGPIKRDGKTGVTWIRMKLIPSPVRRAIPEIARAVPVPVIVVAADIIAVQVISVIQGGPCYDGDTPVVGLRGDQRNSSVLKVSLRIHDAWVI